MAYRGALHRKLCRSLDYAEVDGERRVGQLFRVEEVGIIG